MTNQNPDRIACAQIDKQLTACGWTIQSIEMSMCMLGIGVKSKIDAPIMLAFLENNDSMNSNDIQFSRFS